MIASTENLWERLVNSQKAYDTAAQDFLSREPERLTVVRKALTGPERNTALWVARSLTPDELKQLLPELVHLARSVHGPFEAVWNLILSLPREWVLAHIDAELDAILQHEEEDDYWMFLQLAERLDPALALRLAKRASAHSDCDIRELGEEYVQKWNGHAVRKHIADNAS
jgi:hypothetical protein